MNFKKYFRATALTAAFVLCSSSTTFAAPSFTDIPTTHWAYDAVTYIADKGIIVGNGTPNYNPSDVMDKFSAIRILARVAGYNVTTGFSASVSTTYILEQLKTQLPLTWGKINKDTESSIAYLYENDILDLNDLKSLATKYTDSTEKINNLTREEMAIFLVRTLKKTSSISAYDNISSFSDDALISKTAKSYVYYLKSIGVISGNTENKFNPSSNVSKVEMAVFLYKAMSYMEKEKADDNNNSNNNNSNNNNNNDNTTDSNPVVISTISGTLETVYPTYNVITLRTSDNSLKTCKFETDSLITINEVVSNISSLKAGMTVIITLSNDKISELKATSTTVVPNTNEPTVTDTMLTTRVCTVSSVSVANNSVTVLFQILSPIGDIETETKTYTLAQECIIKKGQTDVSLADISANEVVTIKVYNDKAYSIALEEKSAYLANSVVTDKYLNASNIPVIVVQATDGTSYELKVTSSSDIRRKGEGAVEWQDIKIGDIAEVEKEYNSIVSLYAVGVATTVDGWINSIVICADKSSIVIADKYGKQTEYRVSAPYVLYEMRLGNKVRLKLDSSEVESILIIAEAEGNMSARGTVNTVKYSYIYIDTGASSSYKINLTDNTEVYDSTTDKYLNISDIKANMYIKVMFTNETDNIAKTLTIISK